MVLAYLAFAIGVASPGPSVLAVMGRALRGAALGLAALMQRYAAALSVVKLAGVFGYAGVRMLLSTSIATRT